MYALIALIASALYLTDRQEYSIPLFVVVYLSYPVYFLLFDLLKPHTAFIERLPGGELIGLALLILLTAALYFVLGQWMCSGWRAIHHHRKKPLLFAKTIPSRSDETTSGH